KNRKAGRRADAAECRDSFFQPRSAHSADVGAIRLVETCLVDHTARHALLYPEKRLGDFQVQCVILQDARARNEKEPVARKKRAHDSDSVPTRDSAFCCVPARACSAAAAMNPANNGCGRVGRYLSSG